MATLTLNATPTTTTEGGIVTLDVTFPGASPVPGVVVLPLQAPKTRLLMPPRHRTCSRRNRVGFMTSSQLKGRWVRENAALGTP